MLRERLYLKGAIVTLDAAGCQKVIANKVVERGGNFVLAMKNNQPTLFGDIDTEGKGEFLSQTETWAVAHGRGEYRRCEVLSATDLVTHDEKCLMRAPSSA